MTFTPVIITCPGREALLAQTIDSWRKTDFASVEPLIQMDTNQHARRQERQEHNSLSALEAALNRPNESNAATFILFMEDDIIFNRHIRHNIERWNPLRRRSGPEDAFFASLYDCTIRDLESNAAEHYFIADPNYVYGSQCFLMSASVARYITNHWWEVPGMQDIKMSRLAATRCPIHYHMPSLVQHVGFQSAWGGRFHETNTFDEHFLATDISL